MIKRAIGAGPAEAQPIAFPLVMGDDYLDNLLKEMRDDALRESEPPKPDDPAEVLTQKVPRTVEDGSIKQAAVVAANKDTMSEMPLKNKKQSDLGKAV